MKTRNSEPEARQPLTLDPARYRSHLEKFDLSDSDRSALLEALFGIAVEFVDRAFDQYETDRSTCG